MLIRPECAKGVCAVCVCHLVLFVSLLRGPRQISAGTQGDKCWSNAYQTPVKRRSNAGQMLVKRWSNSGDHADVPSPDICRRPGKT